MLDSLVTDDLPGFQETPRYSSAYEITGEELAWLVERVKILQEAVAAIFEDRLLA